MTSWPTFLHTALLGTDKRQVRKEDISDDLAEAYDLIALSSDKEEQYLQLASAALNYRRCGMLPIHKNIFRSTAEEEVNTYCNAAAQQVLNDIISIESPALFELWLQQCNNRQQIVEPEYIPLLFDLAARYKHLHTDIKAVTGKRGKWLLPFNPDWQLEADVTNEDVFQTGSLEQRKTFLRSLRETDPVSARAVLQHAWPQENANTKTELLKVLSVGISNDDMEWLEQLKNEKSQKVKDEALKLLKLIPGSALVRMYWDILQQSIHLKKEKGLLGMGTKFVLEIKLTANINEDVFKTGIQKLSSEKGGSDNDFILYQLIAAVPPSLWESHFQSDEKEIIAVFNKSKAFKKLIPAFGLAAVIFKNIEWLSAVIAVSESQFYPEALLLLPENEKEKYALQSMTSDESANGLIHYLQLYHKKQWSLELTKAVLKHTASNHYRYNRSFYKENILSFPIEIINELERATPDNPEARNAWAKTTEFIIQLLTLRTQTLKAFQS